MKHLGTKTMETARLILRPFALQDAEAMHRNWAGDSDVTKFLTWKTHRHAEDSSAVLINWVPQYSNDNYYQWAIVWKEINEPIGSIAVVKQSDDIRMVHIGYCIGKKWWNKGITSEALCALTDFFFKEVGINRIESRHDPRNPNSGKVMMKCGMKYEGTKKMADINNLGICDSAEYAILAEEYLVNF